MSRRMAWFWVWVFLILTVLNSVMSLVALYSKQWIDSLSYVGAGVVTFLITAYFYGGIVMWKYKQ